MAVIVILILVLVVAVVGLIAWLPTDAEDHQPLILHDGSQVTLAGGRRRLSTRPGSHAGGGEGGWVGGGGGDAGCSGDGGGCSG